MVKIVRLARGYVRIRVIGPVPQRFMNLCSVHQISLWDIIALDDKYEMNISVSDYFRLKPIVKKTKTKVVLIEKKGLPFRMRKWKKRKAFIFSSIICLSLLYFLSLFLWDIKLVSDGQLTHEMLLVFLQDKNVTYGTRKKDIDINEIEKGIREEFPFVVWTSCRLEGTRMFVNVKENEQISEDLTEKENKACNLCATVSGKVVSIITRTGIPQVKAGDEVKKGDVLVSGEVPVYNDDETIKEYMYVNADADVRLETTIEYKKKLKLDYQKKVYTGREKSTYYFRLFKNSFSTSRLPEYEEYDIVTDLQQAKLLEDFYLPLYYGEITYLEYANESCEYSEKDAEIVLKYDFEKFCKTLQQKGVQIVEKNVRIEKNGRTMHSNGKIRIEMSDGEPEIIRKMKQTGDVRIE